jgi:hypothetical protein
MGAGGKNSACAVLPKLLNHRAMAIRFLQRSVLVCLVSAAALGQSSPPAVDISALTKETQQVDQREGKIGMFWWIPVEFWEQSAKANGASVNAVRRAFAPLGDYTVIVAGAGYFGVGGVNWMPPSDLRGKITLRDQAGTLYKPYETISPDAREIVETLKPLFKNIMGPLADGMNFFFFPAKDANGSPIADPRRASEFSLLVADVMGQPLNTYTWRLPVTELMPPKYCPIGKEKVQANWKYCPWHGTKLDEEPAPPAVPMPSKPQTQPR